MLALPAIGKFKIKICHVTRKPVFGDSDQVRHKWAVQPEKIVSVFEFRIKKVKRLYYLSSENKCADQLCGYRLCFLICKIKVGFSILQLK